LLLGTAPGIGLPDTASNYDYTKRVAVGDFDGDMQVDVIGIDRGRGSTVARLYHGEAGWRFGAGVELHKQAEPTPQDIVAHDFSGDGKLDVAITNRGSVLLFQQSTAGMLEPAGSFAVPALADRLATGDVNADGRSDLVVSTLGGDSLSVLLAQPNGGFAESVDYATGFDGTADGTGAPVVADFNADGYGDIAVADPVSGILKVLFSGASGPFATNTDMSVGPQPRGLVAADFDRDGAVDLATAGDGTIRVLRNQGHGTFDNGREYPVTGPYEWLGSADLNEDGILDLMASGEDMAVLLGRGDGTFEDPVKHGWDGFGSAAIADLDGDGHLDLIAPQVGIVVLRGDGRGGFVEPNPKIKVAIDNGALNARDVNQDGFLDLVVSEMATSGNDPSSTSSVLLGDGTGQFGRETMALDGEKPYLQPVADFDNDGLFDALGPPNDQGFIKLFRGNCSGEVSGETLNLPAYESYSWHAADLNADGFQDLAYLLYDALMIALNDGTGHFLKPARYPFPNSLNSAIQLDIADHDGDGILDASVLVHEPNALLMYRNDGSGAFQLRTTVNEIFGFEWDWPDDLSSGDLNGDGRLDFVIAAGYITVLLAQADGSYAPTRIDPQVAEVSNLHVLDMNSDNIPDIVGWFRYGVVVALGAGDGTFLTPPLPYHTGNWKSCGPIADFNHDGAPDVAFTDYNDSVAVWLNGCGNSCSIAERIERTSREAGTSQPLVKRPPNQGGPAAPPLIQS